MRMMLAGFGLVAVLAGCEETPVAETEDACGASSYQSLIGQDRAAVTAAGLEPGQKVRIYGPGAMLTMDYRADRINVELDSGDRVIKVPCG